MQVMRNFIYYILQFINDMNKSKFIPNRDIEILFYKGCKTAYKIY